MTYLLCYSLSSGEPSFLWNTLGYQSYKKRAIKLPPCCKSQDLPETRHALLASESVKAGGFFVKIRTAGEYLINALFSNTE